MPEHSKETEGIENREREGERERQRRERVVGQVVGIVPTICSLTRQMAPFIDTCVVDQMQRTELLQQTIMRPDVCLAFKAFKNESDIWYEEEEAV